MQNLFRPPSEIVEYIEPEKKTPVGEYTYEGKELKIANEKVYIGNRGYDYETLNKYCFECEIRKVNHILMYDPVDGVLSVFKTRDEPDCSENTGSPRKIQGKYLWTYNEDEDLKTIITVGKKEVLYHEDSAKFKKINDFAIATTEKIFGKKRIMVLSTADNMMYVHAGSNMSICVKKKQKKVTRKTFRDDIYGEWLWDDKKMVIGKKEVMFGGKGYPHSAMNKHSLFVKKFMLREPYLLTYHTGDKTLHLAKLSTKKVSAFEKIVRLEMTVSSQAVDVREKEKTVVALEKEYGRLRKIFVDVQKLMSSVTFDT